MILPEYKIEDVPIVDSPVPDDHVFFDGVDKLWVLNGFFEIGVPVMPSPEDQIGWIPQSAIRHARLLQKRNDFSEFAVIELARDFCETKDGTRWPRPHPEHIKNPKFAEATRGLPDLAKKGQDQPRFHVDLLLLKEIVDFLVQWQEATVCEVWVRDGEGHPLLFIPTKEQGLSALIMPMRKRK